jgi:hypothetical protein
MTAHTLHGLQDHEVLWFRRRNAAAAGAAWLATGGFQGAWAQSRSNVVDSVGDIALNGQRWLPGQSIQTGDEVATGPASRLVFVIGNAAFHVRQNSRLKVGRGASLNAVSLLRLLTGAVVSVFGRGAERAIVTPTLTAGIRGTGVYTEVLHDQRSYFCNCYGSVELACGGMRMTSVSDYHQAFWADPGTAARQPLKPAGAINHTDEELEFLAHLIDQRTAWEIAGRKGVKNGNGYMDDRPGQVHPASMPDR